MNKIVNTFLLAGDKFMPEMHLKQPEFSYSACLWGKKKKKQKKRQRKNSKIQRNGRYKIDLQEIKQMKLVFNIWRF